MGLAVSSPSVLYNEGSLPCVNVDRRGGCDRPVRRRARSRRRKGVEAGSIARGALVVVAFVGWSRVEARKHHVHDVLVGAAIGEASGFLITRRANDHVQVFPWGYTKSGGFAVTMRF